MRLFVLLAGPALFLAQSASAQTQAVQAHAGQYASKLQLVEQKSSAQVAHLLATNPFTAAMQQARAASAAC